MFDDPFNNSIEYDDIGKNLVLLFVVQGLFLLIFSYVIRF